MPDRPLSVIGPRPSWASANVIDCIPGFKGPYFKGQGEENCVCGHCGTVLVRGLVEAMLTIYLCCPECGQYNRAEGGTDAAMA